MIRPFALASALALLPVSAHADWQWSRWGMSVEEVLAASDGRGQLLSDDEAQAASTFVGTVCRVRLDQGHEAGGIHFNEVHLCFDPAGKLARVTLEANGDKAAELERQLSTAFGEPVERSSLSLTFRDPRSGDSVRVVRLLDVLLTYTPAPQGF